ncbi:hypothetical protein N7457_000886 [Penicillium paradoxum]|uniref:uncharacterized protein n=1 Tax=Penicillium paradoxum TaxID=176176 RepID=UPI0025467837|nr:uncharacterized protein N7457_000886 [Penicillium paradoxum]KAJ5794287.1 hypothetical protein N7457_000886 [Penicillium paradoxum]
MSPTPDLISGHLDHLTPEQEAKLRELWTIILTSVASVLSAVCEVPIPEDHPSKLFEALDKINEPTVDAIINALKGIDRNVQTSDGAAPVNLNGGINGESTMKAHVDNIEQKSLGKVDSLMSKNAQETIISEMANRKITAEHFGSLFSLLQRLGVHEGELKSMEHILSDMTPQEMCITILKMNKQESPDSLLLRFLRARKWNVGKAFEMLTANILWRREADVDNEIVPWGERYALEQSRSMKASPKEKKAGADFINQLKAGKSFLHGVDRDGRPVIYIRVKIHKPGDQSEEALERFIIHVIESTRLIVVPPVATGTIVFDMTGFGLSNMDFPPVKFIIRCFEANYPECLGLLLIHNAPWIFSGIWKLIHGLMDPVVASKVHFTRSVADLDEFIPRNKIPKEFSGDENWSYDYVEPVKDENATMEDTDTRDSLMYDRMLIGIRILAATAAWVSASSVSDGGKEASKVEELKSRRNAVIDEFRLNYWRLDPYIRARGFIDRTGILLPGGVLAGDASELKRYLLSHVFLPPRLPQKDDYSATLEGLMLNEILEALRKFGALVSKEDAMTVTMAIDMISRLKSNHGLSGDISESELINALKDLKGHGDNLPIYVRAQNAGILMTHRGHVVEIESFELSARNEAIMATAGRLQRQFPGPTLALEIGTFDDPDFQTELARMLSKMSHQPVTNTLLKVKKAGQYHDEDRDTVHPKMVTEFLMALLRPRSQEVQSVQIAKNTREEVIWQDCRSPWRRSALWLLVRVALQLTFSRFSFQLGPDKLYKGFMVFFMAHVLSLPCPSMSSEDLQLMMAKVGRRLLKMDIQDEPEWFGAVQEALRRANGTIQGRWELINRQSDSFVTTDMLVGSSFHADTCFPLPALDSYLETNKRRVYEQPAVCTTYQPRSKLINYHTQELPSDLPLDCGEYQIHNIAAFENWVALNLNAWLDRNLDDGRTCSRLRVLMTVYHHTVSESSGNNPEAVSVMLLTLLELWIACDRSALVAHDFLSDYDACVPADMFQSLLLPVEFQMMRLARAEEYLRIRQQNSIHCGSCIFRDFGTAACFSVRYFDQSHGHQSLYARIHQKASEDKEKKIVEFRDKRQLWHQYQDKANEIECSYNEVSIYGSPESCHSDTCSRCDYERRANEMNIEVHEWPLPFNELQAKSTVFELNVPQSFASWRDATIYFLVDVLGAGYTAKVHPRATYPLRAYKGLRAYFSPNIESQRIVLLSQIKPHIGTHRREKPISTATEEDVFLGNGLQFQYFDNHLECFTDDLNHSFDIPKMCTYKLPPKSSWLDQFLFRPSGEPNGPSPNTVIATQSVAPEHMALSEYKSLASMPLGVEIQWQNVLLELSSPSMDLKKIETGIFLRQVIHQTGPAKKGTHLRKAHSILGDERFARTILVQVKKGSQRLKENWESIHGLSSLISLVLRILSLSPSSTVHTICYGLLRYLRKIACHWIDSIKDRAIESDNDMSKSDLIAKCVHISLVCTETFGAEDLGPIFANSSDVSIFIQCCILIHDWKDTCTFESDPALCSLYHRWQNLAYRCHNVLADKVSLQRDEGLDMAIQKAWTAYRPASGWSKILGWDDCWLVSRRPSQHGPETGSLVHFNLLTGELLVNGFPLSRLPAEYDGNSSYRTLFGNSHLDVMPSDDPKMHFACQRPHMGHTVYLKMEDIPGTGASRLSVKAINENGTWDLVPSKLLVGLLPQSFIDDFVHWYNIEKDCVEFRQKDAAWQASQNDWRLQRDKSSGMWCMFQQGRNLLGMRTPTAQSVSAIFAPIERKAAIHCSLQSSIGDLHIELPCLRLGFNVHPNCSSLWCQQYPGMVIDPNQTLDTLTGLQSKMVLINPHTKERLLLIPDGDISWDRNGEHINVQITRGPGSKLHAYWIDDHLGRLVDNGNIGSKLLLAYLHPLTSFCLPDLLTARTGTEQGLSILRSASVRSFDRLTQGDRKMLAKIAALTPERRYYPSDERIMQKVSWKNNLASLCQHNDFHKEVEEIFDQDRRMNIFYPDADATYPPLPFVDKLLLMRDRIRVSAFHLSGFGAENHTSDLDRPYKALDAARNSSGANRVYSICKMLYDEHPRIREIVVQDTVQDLWRAFSKIDTVHGTSVNIDVSVMRYDSEWIQNPVEFILSHWCGLHEFIRSRRSSLNKFQFMAWLSSMAFSDDTELILLEILAFLFLAHEIADVSPPVRESFSPREDCGLDRNALRTQIKTAYSGNTPESKFTARSNETASQLKARKRQSLKMNREIVTERMIRDLESQWPTRSPASPNLHDVPKCTDYFNISKVTVCIRKLFATWHDNAELRAYLINFMARISCETACTIIMPSYNPGIPAQSKKQTRTFVGPNDLFCEFPILDLARPELESSFAESRVRKRQYPRLSAFIQSLDLQATSQYEREYVAHLHNSATSLQLWDKEVRFVTNASELEQRIINYLQQCQLYHERVYTAIVSRISSSNGSTIYSQANDSISVNILRTLADVNLLPRPSPMFFLEQLSRSRWFHLSEGWKSSLCSYARSITDLQRAKRLFKLIGNPEQLLSELQTPGHANWKPIDHPESILLEIENDIMIRSIQEETASYMRNLEPGENVVTQLNMGEGKSSVIVPIVAADLANASRLVRVLVAKPQSRQMSQMLVSKLGGLLGRRVYHMPVSRSHKLGSMEADEILRMCQECMSHGGVLLTQPEYILSLKLMCIENFIGGKLDAGRSLLQCLRFFHEYSRDIVDESDENFSVKFEQIYTMGAQAPVEFSPQRWAIVHEVLAILQSHAPGVIQDYPHSIELESQGLARVSRIRLLHRDAEIVLIERVAAHICAKGIVSLPMFRQPETIRQAVLKYVTLQDLTPEDIDAVENPVEHNFWTEDTMNALLLLRGLLAGGVLGFCFGQKRWRVNYGSDPNRSPPTKLAVPFRAKDNPSLKSEFSHPDVIIILTSLNYYYAGLADEDLFLTFNHLVNSDHADTEYQEWVKDVPGLPLAYCQLVGINLDDRHHCAAHIFPALRFSKTVIDYFLSHIVFPKELRGFPHKLSASGWDIGEIKNEPTVGFSGTNDSRKTLPLSVRQLDRLEQSHTNALVLDYLLQPENTVAVEPDGVGPGKSNSLVLFDLMLCLDPPIQVIIDVGAQILELTNLEVARYWLESLPRDGPIQAIVFVNNNDDICVLDQKGAVESLQSSPFARQMEACYVFLDEAHTRGIDLRLPPDYRAAVTLGPNVTKDKLVQACMRMRRLGKGQSVVFCIPREIQCKILTLSGKQMNSEITVSEVLCWAVSETWSETRHNMPLWAVQGRRYERQQEAWHKVYLNDSFESLKNQVGSFLEPECQSLQHRYQPGYAENLALNAPGNGNRNLDLISDRCREFESLNFARYALFEEQERELAPEIELERHVQSLVVMSPSEHHLHADLQSFVATGHLTQPSDAYKPAFSSLARTSVSSAMDLDFLSTGLLVTTDFATTVSDPHRLEGENGSLDAFQRPIRWILTSSTSPSSDNVRRVIQMIIISPFEAEHLLPAIRQSTCVTLHQYAPRQNFAFDSLDRLTLYNVPGDLGIIEIPDGLRIQLNLFAGQLYLGSYSEYQRLCDFLGMASVATYGTVPVDADGWILDKHRRPESPFDQSPVKFLKILMSQIRKDSRNIARTHVGRILNGMLLLPSDFTNAA